ncbi:hypothetical protein ACLOJK_005268 [Asimina triloba]
MPKSLSCQVVVHTVTHVQRGRHPLQQAAKGQYSLISNDTLSRCSRDHTANFAITHQPQSWLEILTVHTLSLGYNIHIHHGPRQFIHLCSPSGRTFSSQ